MLDVAAGNGNASLAAARRWCEVVATDYVPALLERARERAAAERLAIEFREADAEALPFADATFDVVVSTFGVMFTPDQERAAARGIRADFMLVDVRAEILAEIAHLIDAGDLRAGEVGEMLSLEEAVRAHRMLEGAEPHRRGKIVLKVVE